MRERGPPLNGRLTVPRSCGSIRPNHHLEWGRIVPGELPRDSHDQRSPRTAKQPTLEDLKMLRTLMLSICLLLVGLTVATASTTTGHVAKTRARHAAAAMHPRVTLDSATAIASAKVPGGEVKSHELEREKGHLIYSFDFVVAGKPGVEEVNVDAMTGAVLSAVHENAKAEKKENLQEKNEAKSPTTPH